MKEKALSWTRPGTTKDPSLGVLMQRANNGDDNANRQVWEHLDADDTADNLVQTLTDTAYRIRELRHDSPLMKTAYQRKMKQMRKELGVEKATPLERLLIERIVLCWYHLHDCELQHALQMKEGARLEKATYLQMSIDRAEKRYQAAVRSLAVIRLQLPAVQVNIGEKQINIVQGNTSQERQIQTLIEPMLPAVSGTTEVSSEGESCR